MNKIEALKAEKDGLDILNDIPAFSEQGWESIPADDRDRLKWAGIFFRRQTPGRFMMRIRISNGLSSSAQFRAMAGISDDYGKGFADITTRQQVQLREFSIEQVPDIWQRLDAVGLISLQTGMDNVRTVVGCPAAGLTPHELLDASPVAHRFTAMFVGNREYTNLPRKLNVTITGCLENCTHVATQDIAMTPAVKTVDGQRTAGFNVSVGGKMGSGGYTPNTPLDLFATPEEAAEICNHIVLIFRDHGAREARNKARLAFLIESWGVEKFRAELETRAQRPLARAGESALGDTHTDHVGIFPQRQAGLSYVGLCVPVGRITAEQMHGVADLAEEYGDGEIRITPGQNLIIPNVPDARLDELTAEPMFETLSYRPSDITRGTVSCTGIDYCHFSLIETKERAMETARALEQRLPNVGPVSLYWSGCANGCANHALADIGLVGKRVRVDGEILEAVDIYQRNAAGDAGHVGKRPEPVMTNVPCTELPKALEEMLTRQEPGAC